jgi:hypothetical protein
MKRFYIDAEYWRAPLSTAHKHTKRVLLTRARSYDGSSPGWHLWVYTYPKGVQRGRLIIIMGRWVSSSAISGGTVDG